LRNVSDNSKISKYISVKLKISLNGLCRFETEWCTCSHKTCSI